MYVRGAAPVLLASLLVGCGGSGGGAGPPGSESGYAAQMRKPVTVLVAAWNAYDAATGAVTTEQLSSVATEISNFHSTVQTAVAGFEAVDPPSDIAEDHAGLVEVMRNYQEAIGELVADVADGSASAEAESTLEDIASGRGDVVDYLASIANRGYDIGYTEEE